MTTVTSIKTKIFLIITICFILLLIITIILLIFFFNIKSPQSSSTDKLISQLPTTTTLSPEELHQISSFKKFLNLPNTYSNPNPTLTMNKYMRTIYQQINDQRTSRRKKRSYLVDQTDFIVSLPNQNLNSYHFEYNSSLEYLINVEFILPIEYITSIDLFSSLFNITIKTSIEKNQKWLKINLTKFIKSFPLKFHMNDNLSSGFLILYFRHSSHSIVSRDLSFYDNQLVTYPDDPSYCQVRPLRTSFTELNWSSWIIEPKSYDMNICSGTCHTQSNMGTYFLLQNLLNQKYPKEIPAPCCKPKRFSSTIILYYDGPNLILKRHENMRVVECGCS